MSPFEINNFNVGCDRRKTNMDCNLYQSLGQVSSGEVGQIVREHIRGFLPRIDPQNHCSQKHNLVDNFFTFRVKCRTLPWPEYTSPSVPISQVICRDSNHAQSLAHNSTAWPSISTKLLKQVNTIHLFSCEGVSLNRSPVLFICGNPLSFTTLQNLRRKRNLLP